jgi:hypothetical protein
MAHGTQRMAHGAWRMAHGAWRMAQEKNSFISTVLQSFLSLIICRLGLFSESGT